MSFSEYVFRKGNKFVKINVLGQFGQTFNCNGNNEMAGIWLNRFL